MAADDTPHGNLPSPAPSERPRPLFSRGSSVDEPEDGKEEAKPAKWGMGILNDAKTNEVPGMTRNSHTPRCLSSVTRVASTNTLPQARSSSLLANATNPSVFEMPRRGR